MKFPNSNSTWKTCAWISDRPRRCRFSEIAATCRGTCGTCGVCVDSPYEFKCFTNGRMSTGVAEACPKTCGLCN